MLRYLPLVLFVAFVVYCVFDVVGSDERRRRGLPVPLWLLLVVLVPVVGGVVWLLVSRGTPHQGTAARGGGPVAPDDDPEFLFRLDQERRRRERQDGAQGQGPRDEGTDGTGSADGTPAA
ncbi:MAG: PLDc N-terminal domain-containing protein [Cellulomonas sp.]|uniref:PLDc N-terminal domain-containing protein n=1 Tax=Cellulomonas sp. TaxID=40001 RepID=UPI0019DCAE16|nr:PLDc N-terminal domain-containing protein [Cellulomonas sp.]MBF0686524.1 PLDc N-terminal domain-containing protein [Cellulomonas sp.]